MSSRRLLANLCFLGLTLLGCQSAEDRALEHLSEGQMLFAASQPAEAEAAYERALAESPSLDAWLGLARARAALEAWAPAQEAAEPPSARSPSTRGRSTPTR